MNRTALIVGLGIGVWLIANAVLLGLGDRWSAGNAVGRYDSGWSIAAPGTQTGFLRRLYIDPGGTAHRYVVFVPAGTPENSRWPVILYLNGLGKNGSDGIAPLRDGLAPVIWETQRTFPFVAVFPQCTEGGSWSANGPDAERALAILDDVSREFPVDPDRVILTGLSSGGSGVWSMASRWPKRFAAIAPMSAGGMDTGTAGEFARHSLPIWMFWVRKDDQDLVHSNRAMYQALVEAGADVRGTEVDGGGHPHDSWDFAFRHPAFLDWLVNQRRNSEPDAQPEYVHLIEGSDLEGWTAESGTWTVEPGRLLRGTTGDAGSAVLVKEITAQDFELFGEFDWSVVGTDAGDEILSNVREGGIGLLSATESTTGTAETGVVWKIVDPDFGSGGLYAVGRQEWRVADDPVAQRSLRRDGWNDFCIRRTAGGIEARINGRAVLSYRGSETGVVVSRISLQVEGRSGAAMKFRNLRLWKISGDETANGSRP